MNKLLATTALVIGIAASAAGSTAHAADCKVVGVFGSNLKNACENAYRQQQAQEAKRMQNKLTTYRICMTRQLRSGGPSRAAVNGYCQRQAGL